MITIDNITDFTDQQVFDFVAGKLLAQGQGAMVRGNCVYRCEDGRKCAVGHLIPDALYSDRMEGNNVDSVYFPAIRADSAKLSLMQCLQQAHDWAADAGRTDDSQDEFLTLFKNRMRSIAAGRSLSAEVLEGVGA
jgi:hypothetical protein